MADVFNYLYSISVTMSRRCATDDGGWEKKRKKTKGTTKAGIECRPLEQHRSTRLSLDGGFLVCYHVCTVGVAGKQGEKEAVDIETHRATAT